MSELRIGIFQSSLLWENRAGNLQELERQLNTLAAGSLDLIVFPEMFTTGFSMEPSTLSESMDGRTVEWMKNQASRLSAVLTGSVIIEDEENFYNRMLFVFPDGQMDWYDKRHLFTLAGEDQAYEAGTKRVVIEVKGWKIFPQVCYDLRFPAWSRNNLDYDLLLYVANWPKPRHEAWRSLLVARAIENQAYAVGVNRWGEDGNGLEYLGGSAIIDYVGLQLLEMEEEGFQQYVISKEPMMTFRQKLNFLADQDEITYN